MPQNFPGTGTPLVVTPPTSPSVCRVYADFINPRGNPIQGLTVRVKNTRQPIVTGSQGVVGPQVEATTDALGHLELDLLREGQYVAVIHSFQDDVMPFTVPDQATFNLISLLAPTVISATLNPATLSSSVDDVDTLVIDGVLSDTRAVTLLPSAVTWASDDEAVATVSQGIVSSLAVGTANISISAIDLSVVPEVLDVNSVAYSYIPEQTVTYNGCVVTVS